MHSMNFTYTDLNDVEITMNVPERDINEMCEYFQRFLLACGYVLEDTENIKVVKEEKDMNKYTSHGNYDPWIFYEDNAISCSGVRGGMAEDLINLS